MDKMLQPGIIGVTDRRQSVLPANVIAQLLAVPITHIERRVSQNEVGFEIRMAVIEEGIA